MKLNYSLFTYVPHASNLEWEKKWSVSVFSCYHNNHNTLSSVFEATKERRKEGEMEERKKEAHQVHVRSCASNCMHCSEVYRSHLLETATINLFGYSYLTYKIFIYNPALLVISGSYTIRSDPIHWGVSFQPILQFKLALLLWWSCYVMSGEG